MSYILESQTIARPQEISKEPVEVSSTHTTIGGVSKRDITSRKYRYILKYRGISKSDADTIMAIYALKDIVTFESTEPTFTVSQRDVLVDIAPREYRFPGTSYLSDLDLILTEVEE